ncbi:uncharacterized protein B0I36DRAFT_310765 [Microdochium trichocladiopsis]|uniref:Uncharacterized protein n=1 Tax=Microdochium trichocladiopsis TaxID=1682393 RepID=A0A9P8YHP5_9PEZI|nr:uncharacterized protein B0I36DRAFT_310765 [Microdochium trichocladiopsis]KAH7040475.1 hypothetical protein B0I36DRAFT_310765 [Microdochium trichocladiopsis]
MSAETRDTMKDLHDGSTIAIPLIWGSSPVCRGEVAINGEETESQKTPSRRSAGVEESCEPRHLS